MSRNLLPPHTQNIVLAISLQGKSNLLTNTALDAIMPSSQNVDNVSK